MRDDGDPGVADESFTKTGPHIVAVVAVADEGEGTARSGWPFVL
jgi:hypothetical protein